MSRNKKFCQHCGVEIQHWMTFCHSCGGLLEQPTGATQTHAQQPVSAQRPLEASSSDTGKALLIAVFVVLAIALAAVVTFLAVGGSENTKSSNRTSMKLAGSRSTFYERERGKDACAESLARTMTAAIETYYTDNNSYVGADAPALRGIESLIKNGTCGAGTTISIGDIAVPVSVHGAGGCTGSPTLDTYCVSAISAATSGGANHSFTITRHKNGSLTRTCGPTNRGGCVAAGTW